MKRLIQRYGGRRYWLLAGMVLLGLGLYAWRTGLVSQVFGEGVGIMEVRLKGKVGGKGDRAGGKPGGRVGVGGEAGGKEAIKVGGEVGAKEASGR